MSGKDRQFLDKPWPCLAESVQLRAMAGSQPRKDESEKKATQRRSLFLLVADDERDTVETLCAILVDRRLGPSTRVGAS